MTSMIEDGALGDNAVTTGQYQALIDQLTAFIRQAAAGGTDTLETSVIAGGEIIPGTLVTMVDTEEMGSADNLDRVNPANLPRGSVMFLTAADPNRVVTVRHGQGGTGEVRLVDGLPLVLSAATDWVVLARTNADIWVEVGRRPDPLASQQEAQEGSETAARRWSPALIKTAIGALAAAGASGPTLPSTAPIKDYKSLDVRAATAGQGFPMTGTLLTVRHETDRGFQVLVDPAAAAGGALIRNAYPSQTETGGWSKWASFGGVWLPLSEQVVEGGAGLAEFLTPEAADYQWLRGFIITKTIVGQPGKDFEVGDALGDWAPMMSLAQGDPLGNFEDYLEFKIHNIGGVRSGNYEKWSRGPGTTYRILEVDVIDRFRARWSGGTIDRVTLQLWGSNEPF